MTLGVVVATLRRDALITRSYRGALVLDAASAVVGISIYYFISRTFARAEGVDLQGAPSYFAFALVGVVLTMILQSAALGLGRRLREEQLTGTLEALVAQPAGDARIAFGLACFPFAFATLRASLYLLVAGLLLDADFGRADWIGWVAVLAATAAFALGLGLALGAAVLVFKRAEVIGSFATLALALAGGAYFPVSALPDWLSPVADLAPTRLAFDGARAALYEGSGWAGDAAGLALLSGLLIPAGLWLFVRALKAQRRRGTLLEY